MVTTEIAFAKLRFIDIFKFKLIYSDKFL